MDGETEGGNDATGGTSVGVLDGSNVPEGRKVSEGPNEGNDEGLLVGNAMASHPLHGYKNWSSQNTPQIP